MKERKKKNIKGAKGSPLFGPAFVSAGAGTHESHGKLAHDLHPPPLRARESLLAC